MIKTQGEVARKAIFKEIEKERLRQDGLWGEQNHPIRREVDAVRFEWEEKRSKVACDNRAKEGTLSWHDILKEEFYEVFATANPAYQRYELIHLIAVGTAMVEYLDRKRLTGIENVQ